MARSSTTMAALMLVSCGHSSPPGPVPVPATSVEDAGPVNGPAADVAPTDQGPPILEASFHAGTTFYWLLPDGNGRVCQPWKAAQKNDPNKLQLVRGEGPKLSFTAELDGKVLRTTGPVGPSKCGQSEPLCTDKVIVSWDDAKAVQFKDGRWFFTKEDCEAAPPTDQPPKSCMTALVSRIAVQARPPTMLARTMKQNGAIFMLTRKDGALMCDEWRFRNKGKASGTLEQQTRQGASECTASYEYTLGPSTLTLSGQRGMCKDGGGWGTECFAEHSAFEVGKETIMVNERLWFTKKAECERVRDLADEWQRHAVEALPRSRRD